MKIRESIKKQVGNPFRITVPVIICALFYMLAITSIKDMGATSDEGYHVVRGVMLLKTGDLRLSQHHPYLSNLINSIPAVINPNTPDLPTDGNPLWEAGDKDGLTDQLVEMSGGVLIFSQKVLFWPRVSMILMGTMLVGGLYYFLKHQFGDRVATLGALFLALMPGFIAHSSIITTDLPATITIFLGSATLFLYLRKLFDKQSSKRSVRIAFAIFILASFAALITKYSAVIIAFTWLMILGGAVLYNSLPNRIRLDRSLLLASLKGVGQILVVVVAWFALMVGAYKFQFMTLHEHDIKYPGNHDPAYIEQVRKDQFRKFERYGALDAYYNIPVPFPEYIKGFSENVVGKQISGHESFFRGKYHEVGNSYHLVGLMIKEPEFHVVTLIASPIMVGTLSIIWIRKNRKDLVGKLKRERFIEKCILYSTLIVPPLFMFTLASVSSIKLGIRHILPIYPFLAIAIALFWDYLISKHKAFTYAVLAGVALTLFSILSSYPNYLGYFNLFVGGSKNGYLYMHDSALDWAGRDEFKGNNEVRIYKYIVDHPELEILYDHQEVDAFKQIRYPGRVDKGRYYMVRLIKAFQNPFFQTETSRMLKEIIQSGEYGLVKEFSNTHILIYVPAEGEEVEKSPTY